MDPAESILSMLDYSFDSILQNESNYHMDMNLGLDEVFTTNNDLLSTDDNLISDVLNDDLLNSLDFADSLPEADLFEPLLNSKNFKPRNKSKITLNSIKNTNSLQPHKAFSILNNSANDRNIKAKLSMCAPKVYVSQSPKQTTVQAGTSILIKKETGRKPKRRSLLQSSETTIKYNSFLSKPTEESTKRNGILKDVFFYSLMDHDYCLQPANEFSNFQPKSNNSDSYSHTNVETQMKNEIEDMLQGFIPDDVMLNELPNCLKDLIDLDNEMMLNSEDVLHGLNDACNLMADQYIDNLEEELFSMDKSFNLPNLNITEDDLNEVTQTFAEEDGSCKEQSAAKDIEIDIVYSPFTESVSDNFDCASTSTGCTEESSSEEGSCHLSRSHDISKRHRSLSSSSSVTSRRKRRFSSRSSLNSSDSMSDSSSVDSVSSSRSSSPDRSLNLPGFGSFSSNFGSPKHHLKSNKNRLRKQSNWTSKYSNKFIKPPSVKKKKAVDMSHRSFSLSSGKELSRLDSGSSHKVGSGDGEINEKVLYIGDIPDETSKSDIRSWFGKYGTIEDIQLYFCETSNNYAFVTFKYSQETKNAIKYGNDELRKLKFVLSYGRRRNSSYKDLDFFSEENLDFRIEQRSKELDFDSLLRSTTAESYKLKQYV